MAAIAGLLVAALATATSFCGVVASTSASVVEATAQLEEIRQLLETGDARLHKLQDAPRKLVSVEGNTTTTPMLSIHGDLSGSRVYTAVESQEGALTHMWLVFCGALAMFVQVGLMLAEAGRCRLKNAQGLLLKGLISACVGTLGWWLFGWSFAFSGPVDTRNFKDNGFIGYEQFAGHLFLPARDDGQLEPTTAIAKWHFQWAMCLIAVAVAASGAAERVRLPCLGVYCLLMASFIYPVVASWTWGRGWLASINNVGYVDFAGSGVVHLTGGSAALAAALLAGPRCESVNGKKQPKDNRFAKMKLMPRIVELHKVPEEGAEAFLPHSQPMVCLGTFITWFGFYGVCCGSSQSLNGIEKGFQAAQVATNITVSAAAAALLVFLFRLLMTWAYKGKIKYDLGAMCHGVLAGLVSISAACSTVETGAALAIGLIGAFIFQLSSSLLKAAKIDDPVDAFAVHGACGAWGLLAAAVFDWGQGFEVVHGWSGFKCMGYQGATLDPNSFQYADTSCPKDGAAGLNLLKANALMICAVAGWSGGITALVFSVFKLLKVLDDKDYPHERTEACKLDFDNAPGAHYL
jgi:Amt family ammonium transporter